MLAKLLASPVLQADETDINIIGKNHWLHGLSSTQFTLYHAHAKRGLEAMRALTPVGQERPP